MNHDGPNVASAVILAHPDSAISTRTDPHTFRKTSSSPKSTLSLVETTFLNTNKENTIELARHGKRVHRNTFTEEPGQAVRSSNSNTPPQTVSQPHKIVSVHTSHPQHHLAITTHHPHHLSKRSVSLHEPSKPLTSNKPLKPRKVPTQNFTLDIQGEHVLLFYGKKSIIDLTSPSKLSLTSKDTVLYRRRTISVISGITQAERYSTIDKLAIYSGTGMTTGTTLEDKGIVLRAASAELYVSGNTAFYSRSKHFNDLLSKRLEEIIANRNHARIPVEFRVFSGGKILLTINNTSIIVLTDAEFRRVSNQQTLFYDSNTLLIQERTQVGILEVFPAIENLLTLTALGHGEGITKHNSSLTRIILGGGDLYVHKQTRTAFYSRDVILNNEISEFLMGLRPSLRNVVFSIRFETGVMGGTLEVVIAANGNDILTLKPHRVIDQSVAARHHVTYANSTVYVMDGEEVLDAIENIKEIQLHNDDQLHLYTTEASELIPGGGQLFTCQGLGLYSVDADLNDRIGDALLGAETQPPMPPPSGCGPRHCHKDTDRPAE